MIIFIWWWCESESRSVLSDSLGPHGLYNPRNSPGQNAGAGSHSLSRGSSQLRDRIQVSHFAGRFFIIWTTREALKVEGAQLCPTFCHPMDYAVHGILQARILEWVAFPFSRGSSQPRNLTYVCQIAGKFLTSWATREALMVQWGLTEITHINI